MLPVVLRTLRLAMVRAQMQEPVLKKPQGPVISLAESPACFGHLVKNRLEPGGASYSSKDTTNRALLLPRILEFAGEVHAVPRNVSHSGSLGRRAAQIIGAAWIRTSPAARPRPRSEPSTCRVGGVG